MSLWETFSFKPPTTIKLLGKSLTLMLLLFFRFGFGLVFVLYVEQEC